MIHGTKGTHTTEFLERNHRLVILLLIVHDDLLVITFTDNKTSVTPAEIIHAPEGINREEETVHRVPERTRRVSEDEGIPNAATYERR